MEGYQAGTKCGRRAGPAVIGQRLRRAQRGGSYVAKWRGVAPAGVVCARVMNARCLVVARSARCCARCWEWQQVGAGGKTKKRKMRRCGEVRAAGRGSRKRVFPAVRGIGSGGARWCAVV